MRPTVPPTTVAPGPVSFTAQTTRSKIGGCDVFPADHFLNATNIDRLPVHPSSDAWLSGLRAAGKGIVPPSSTVWEGSAPGIPINVVDSTTTGFSSVSFTTWTSPYEYRGQYPLPANPKIEGYPTPAWDKHLLIVDSATCTAYELIQFDPLVNFLIGRHSALSGATYSLNSTERVRYTTNSPSTPMIGQAYKAEDATAGNLPHVTSFCSNTISTSSVWPAARSDGKVAAKDGALPMGAWARLKAGVDTSKFTGQAGAIVRALRTHGMVLTDTCAHDLHIVGENSSAWDNNSLRQLKSLTPSDFEIVDTTPMKVAENSFAVR